MTVSIMAAFWRHFLVSGRMSSPSLMMWRPASQSGVCVTDFDISLPFSPFRSPPQWTSVYADPDPPRQSGTKIHEMRCQKLLSPRYTGKMWQTKHRRRIGPEPSGVMRIVWLHFTADGRINLPATRCGQAFPTSWRQIWLRSQITPWRHFTL